MKKLTAEMYVEIYKDIIRNTDDYEDKTKVKKHNAAYSKIGKGIKDIQEDKDYLKALLSELLMNEDEIIQLSAATKCLGFDILVNEAVECLNKLKSSKSLSGVDKLGIDMTLCRQSNREKQK